MHVLDMDAGHLNQVFAMPHQRANLTNGVFGAKRPLRYLQKSWRMYRYGAWLTREARTGRFHYLPAEEVTARLNEAGFTQISHRLSYCDQAYIFTCARS